MLLFLALGELSESLSVFSSLWRLLESSSTAAASDRGKQAMCSASSLGEAQTVCVVMCCVCVCVCVFVVCIVMCVCVCL